MSDASNPHADLRASLARSPPSGKRGLFIRINEGSRSKLLVERCRDSLRQIIIDQETKNFNTFPTVTEIEYLPMNVATNLGNHRTTRGSLLTKSVGKRGLMKEPPAGFRRLSREISKLLAERCRESLHRIVNHEERTEKDEFKETPLRVLTSFATAGVSDLTLETSLFDSSETSEQLSKELGIDPEEQLRLMQGFEDQKKASETRKMSAQPTQIIEAEVRAIEQDVHPLQVPEKEEMVDICPGIVQPLRSSDESWQAIMEGNVVVTQCCCCSQELTCIEDAEYIVCSDCMVFNRLHKKSEFVLADGQRRHARGVCIGVSSNDIVEWLRLSAPF
jgi:hypothetical protein